MTTELIRNHSSRGSLHFPVDEPLPEALVRKLVEARMAEAFDNR